MRQLFNMWAALWQTPTLEEVMEHEEKKAQQEAKQAQAVLRSHNYQYHMAQAKLMAIETWRQCEAARQTVPAQQ
jgi:hypothetical protein